MKYNFAYIASNIKNTETQEKFLINQGCIKIEKFFDLKNHKINFLFVLGGDGFMLRVLHKFLNYQKINYYGINCGTQGFLLNNFENIKNKSIEEIAKNIKKYRINPLTAIAINNKGKRKNFFAINEISLLRNKHNTSHIRIYIDDKERLDNLISDGVIVCSPAGSTAYNLSLNGPILPLNSNFLSITPISPFKPRLWKGAIIKNSKKIKFKILDTEKRGVNMTADFIEYKNISEIEIKTDYTKNINLLFNKNENIEEKIINQQFFQD